jgi:hypothetical protein
MFHGNSILYKGKLSTLVSSGNTQHELEKFYDDVVDNYTNKYSLTDIEILFELNTDITLSPPIYVFSHDNNDQQFLFCSRNSIKLSSDALLYQKQQEMFGILEKTTDKEEEEINAIGKVFSEAFDMNAPLGEVLGLDKNDKWDVDRDKQKKKHDRKMKKALTNARIGKQKKIKKDEITVISGEIGAKTDKNGKTIIDGVKDIIFNKNTTEVDETAVERIKKKRLERDEEFEKMLESGDFSCLFNDDEPTKKATTGDK